MSTWLYNFVKDLLISDAMFERETANGDFGRIVSFTLFVVDKVIDVDKVKNVLIQAVRRFSRLHHGCNVVPHPLGGHLLLGDLPLNVVHRNALRRVLDPLLSVLLFLREVLIVLFLVRTEVLQKHSGSGCSL